MKKKYIIPEIKAIAICHQWLMQSSSVLSDEIDIPVSDSPEIDGSGD